MNLNLKAVLFLCIVVSLLVPAVAWTKFCSLVCKSGQCNDCTSNGCNNQCNGNWMVSGSSCAIDPASGWEQISVSPDVLPASTMSLSDITAGTCAKSGNNCDYTYYGDFDMNSVQTITDPTIFVEPHYAVRIMMWVILLDNWSSGKSMVVTMNPGTSAAIIKKMARSSRTATQKVCGNDGNFEDYLRIDMTFNHNDSVTPITWTLTSDETSNVKYGYKEVYIWYDKCNINCTSCWSRSISNCWSCSSDLNMMLNNFTCASTCLTGFGQTIDPNVCVWCNRLCLVCYGTANNCSSCQPTGTFASFLSGSSCTVTCPLAQFGNTTTRVCDPCAATCATCSNPVTCLSCAIATPILYYYQGTCVNPCPIGTYANANNINCTACSSLCISCSGSSITCDNCTQIAPNIAYLSGTTCYRTCPNGFFGQTIASTNLCSPCDASCQICTGTPSPCSYCSLGNYLYQNTCGPTCPPSYFARESTRKCLDCQTSCVRLTIKMYFPTVLNHDINIDFTFSEDIDWTSFDYQKFQTISFSSSLYNIDMFNATFSTMNTRTYRLKLTPKGYIFLYNVTITCTTVTKPTPIDTASDLTPFHESCYSRNESLIWFVIKAPSMSATQESIITGLSSISTQVQSITTLPYFQEIKKLGVFGFLFAGAQITSSAVVVDTIQSQNMYEGIRFWAMFVYFDVPDWERNSNKQRNVVAPSVQSVVQTARLMSSGPIIDSMNDSNSIYAESPSNVPLARLLFDISSVRWRFQRVGQSSFFLFDVYPQIILVVVSWIMLIIATKCLSDKPQQRHKLGFFYTVLHRCHQISIFYIGMGTMLEWMYFSASSGQRWASIIVCMLINFYFLCYHLYIYFDLMKYPHADIGSEAYEKFALRYGCLLRSVRYQDYDPKEPWSPKHWLRPYNYHLLSFYKKLMMIISLPLFYDIANMQAGVLFLLQLAEIIRFCCIWPFRKKWRNWVRLSLELCLLLFFLSVELQGFIVPKIMLNDSSIEDYIQNYYRLGWIGFVMVFIFNIGFLVLGLLDLVTSCRVTNEEQMNQSRREFFYGKLRQYNEHEAVPLNLLNNWVKKGNLNSRNYDTLPDINLRLQLFRIRKTEGQSYQVDLKLILDIKMNIEFNFQKENNISPSKKINKRIKITRSTGETLFNLVDDLWQCYGGPDVESITLKTFQLIHQNNFKAGQSITLDSKQMTQRVQLDLFTGERQKVALKKIIPGFPLDKNVVETIMRMK